MTNQSDQDGAKIPWDGICDSNLVRWWASRAEFPSKYYKGYGYFFGTARDLGGIYQYIGSYIEKFRDVPRGQHVVRRNYNENDKIEFIVQFPMNLPFEKVKKRQVNNVK